MKWVTFAKTAAAFLATAGQLFGAADLVPTKLQLPTYITNSPLPQVTIKWAVTNQGDTLADGFWDGIYVSTNTTVDASTPQVANWYVSSLGAGASYSKIQTFQLPIGYSGDYYLIFKTDIFNSIQESDYSNNTVVSPLHFEAVPSDLAISKVVVPAVSTVPPNPSFTVIWSVTNLGPGTAGASWFDNVYLSTNTVLDAGASPVGVFYSSTPLAAGQTYWQTNQVLLPIVTNGNYYLIFDTDVYNSLFELNLSNNIAAVPVSFTVQPPDLAALPLQVPTQVTSLAYPSLQMIAGVTNTGPVVAQGYWYDVLYFSTNAVLDQQNDGVLLSRYEHDPVSPATSYFLTNFVQLPVSRSGTYYLFFFTDAQNSLGESTLTNNVATQAITLNILQPDLVPIAFQVPTVVTSPPNPILNLSWGVTNQGNGATGNYWPDQVYLSQTPVLDSTATPVLTSTEYYSVDAGDSYWRSNQVQLPVTQSGSYYLIFQTDTANSINESDTNNNTIVRPITFTIQPPDLSPVALQVAGPITSPPNPTVQVVWGVTNSGIGAARGNWYDKLYFSTDPQLDASDQQQLLYSEYGPIPPGGSYWRTNSLQLPVTRSGTYYLIFVANADSYNKIIESDYTDNVRVLPITFTILPPDLVPLVSRLPARVVGPPFPMTTVVWGITNQGIGTARSTSWTDGLYLSANPFLDPTNQIIAPAYEYGSIPPGGVRWLTNTVLLPVSSSGTNYFIVQANLDDTLFESDYNNNTAIAAVDVEIQPPDLAPISLLAPSVINDAPYPAVTVIWGVTNQGVGDAIGHYAWYDHLYVSTNAIWDPNALDVLALAEQGPIQAGGAYWRTNTTRLPLTTSGTYYLFFRVNIFDDLIESNYNNNTTGLPFTFNMHPPDLAPINVQVPNSVTGPPYPSLTYVWGVTNQGTGTALAYNASWIDQVVLSSNGFWDLPGYQLAANYQNGPVAPGGVYWQTNTLRVPVTQSGTYFLIFNTDQYQSLLESDYDNNVVVAPVTFTIQPPDLAPLALQVPSTLTCPPNPTLTIVWGVTNQGIGTALGNYSWYDGLYLSTDPFFDFQDLILTTVSEPGPIQPGQTYWRTNSVRLPVTQSGTYYLIFRVDSGNDLVESNETNNVFVAPITLTVLPPDLAPVPPPHLTITGPPNPSFSLVWGVTNQGPGQAVPYWYDSVYLSKNPTLDPQDPQIAYNQETVPIDPGSVLWQTNSVSWAPVVQSGNYYLIFYANAGGASYLFESDYSNNLAAVPITFNIQPPDLAPVALQVPAQLTTTPNPILTFVWGITNQGSGLATAQYSVPNWSDVLFLSTNAVLDDTAQAIDTDYAPGPVPSGGSYWRTNSVLVPVTRSGTYYFILQTDSNGFLFESDYNNNTIVVPVTFNILPPDLSPVALMSSTVVTSTPNPQLSIVCGVTNQGIGAAQGSWYDVIYLSTNSTLDDSAVPVFSQIETGPIHTGSNYWSTNLVHLPVLQSGNYYIIFKVNNYASLFESDFNNNLLSLPLTFTILPPDLAPIALRAPATFTGPPNSSIQLEWGVTNQGVGVAMANNNFWTDRIYLSSGPTLTFGQSWELDREFESGPIAPGGQYWHSRWVRVPVTTDGTYYLIFQTDTDNALYESSEDNNTTVVPITIKVQVPDLVPLALRVPSLVTGSAKPDVKFTWGVTNQGTGAAISAWQDSFYLSTDASLDSSDTWIGAQYQPGALPAGSSYWRAQTFQVPVQTSGNYFIILQTVTANSIGEFNSSNNTLAVPVTFNLTAPDLVPIDFQAPAQVAGSANPGIRLVWGVTNQGPGVATNANYGTSWYDKVFLSTNAALDTQNDLLIFTDDAPTDLPAGGTYWRTNIVHLPLTNDGLFYLHFQANADSYQPLYESDYTNNVATVPIRFQLVPPDFALLSLQGPTNLSGAQLAPVTFVWGVTNLGPGTALGAASTPWVDTFTLTKLNPDGSNLWITSWGILQSNVVNPGQIYWTTNQMFFPAVAPGLYELTITADAFNDLGERNTNNNTTSIDISVNLDQPVLPDLLPIGFSAPAMVTGPPNPIINLSWGATNQSAIALSLSYGMWFDVLYLSTNAFLDESAMFLRSWQTNFIPAAGSYWHTDALELPVQASGNYFLILQIDAYNVLAEANETNNTAILPITVNLLPPADLKPLALEVPTTINGPPNPPLTIVWGVTNLGSGTAQSLSGWWDDLFLSTSPSPNSGGVVAVSNETNQIAPGGVYWRTNTLIAPVTDSGTYYFRFSVNSAGNLIESDYGNNDVLVPVTFNIVPPDLVPVTFLAPLTITGAPKPTLTVIAGVTNQGLGSALPGTDVLYISATPFLDSSAQAVAYFNRTSTIPSGGVYWLTNSVQLPTVDSGNYYLLFQADQDNYLGEFESLNNLAVAPIHLDLSLRPDLVLHEFQHPAGVTGAANPRVQLAWHVTNEGLGPAVAPWSDAIVLFTNLYFYPGVPLVSVPSPGSLPVGVSYWQTNSLRLPVSSSGTVYLSLAIDGGGNLADLDYNNNSQLIPITVTITNTQPVSLAGGQILPDASFQLGVSGTPGAYYTLQSSTNLIDWFRVLDFICTNAAMPLADPQPLRSAQNFYRVAPYFEDPSMPFLLDFAAIQPSTPNGLALKLDGALSNDYRVQTSTNLLDWLDLTNFPALQQSPVYFRDRSAANSPRFYRAVSP